MARTWKSHNYKVFSDGIAEFMDRIIGRLYLLNVQSAAEVMAYIQSVEDTDDMPVDTRNLMEGTGFGIYQDSTLKQYIQFPKNAIRRQHMGGYGNAIWGSDMLHDAIQAGVSDYPNGTWLVLISAVPYADYINLSGSPALRGESFFNKLIGKCKVQVELNLSEYFPNAKRV